MEEYQFQRYITDQNHDNFSVSRYQLYLLRHGESEQDGSTDAALSAKGVNQVKDFAFHTLIPELTKGTFNKIKVQLPHSPRRRAQQTAKTVMDVLCNDLENHNLVKQKRSKGEILNIEVEPPYVMSDLDTTQPFNQLLQYKDKLNLANMNQVREYWIHIEKHLYELSKLGIFIKSPHQIGKEVHTRFFKTAPEIYATIPSNERLVKIACGHELMHIGATEYELGDTYMKQIPHAWYIKMDCSENITNILYPGQALAQYKMNKRKLKSPVIE